MKRKLSTPGRKRRPSHLKMRKTRNTAAAEIIMAVRAVYMEEPFRKLWRQEVSHRVQAVATEHYVSAREVYNWLARARRMWLRYRE